MTLTASLLEEQELKFIYIDVVFKWHDTTTTTMMNYGKPHDQATFQRVFNYRENCGFTCKSNVQTEKKNIFSVVLPFSRFYLIISGQDFVLR